MTDSDEVARLYDSDPEREWARLNARCIEFGVTSRALSEHLPTLPARVLDVGSGPGRYALALAQRGYTLSIVDVSRECLNLAQQEAARVGVAFDSVLHASAADLGDFSDSTFDAVLLFGPLYHLKEFSSRSAAVREAVRVLKPGGILFSAFLNRYSVVRYAAKARPEQLSEDPKLVETILADGSSDSQHAGAGFLRTCYFADPTKIQDFMEPFGLMTLDVVGCEGVVAELEDHLCNLRQDELARWVDINYELGRKKELLAASAHLLHVARKPPVSISG